MLRRLVLLVLFAPLGSCAPNDAGTLDPLGIVKLESSRSDARTYFATSWGNGRARQFTDTVDPMDPWLDGGHGSGRYSIDGKGTLTASGDYVRLYVHNPDLESEWGEDLEITTYVTRVSETEQLSYSGPQIFARTNHGTFTGSLGSEERTPCDDRGVGGKINVNGTWAFEKETHHGSGLGYATIGAARLWDTGLPVNVPVGVKYLVQNVGDGEDPSAVHLSLYVDMTDGAGGGTWTKVTEYTDTGQWGVGRSPCAGGADPAALPVRARLLPNSETGRPMLTVYFRHEFGTMRYSRLSVREINPLPRS
jgi:hypothetical protein